MSSPPRIEPTPHAQPAERTPSERTAWQALRRRLVRRRLDRVELALRIEIALLAVVVASFLFWRMRVVFASIAHDRGPLPVAGLALLTWTLFALAGAGIVAARHAQQRRGRLPGPPWLALPITPGAIQDHLSWEARTHALWVAPAAPAALAALIGLVPGWWIAVLAALFVLVFEGLARAASVLAIRFTPGVGGLDPLLGRLVVTGLHDSRQPRSRPVRWRRTSPWRALWSKDLLVTLRTPAPRRRTAPFLVLGLLSIGAWVLPFLPPHPSGGTFPPELARILAFGLALAAAATFGEWLITLAGEDPFPVLRALPVAVGALWASRVAWVVVGALTLVAAHAASGRSLSPEALELFLIWIGAATLAIGVLAVNYGLTLYPRADVAQRLFALALGIAVAASLMIPLLGWVTLLAGVLHSLRRLPRWSRLDPI